MYRLLVEFLESLFEDKTYHVKDEIEHEKCKSADEYRAIFDGAVRRIAEAYLHDVCGYRGHRLERIDGKGGLLAGGYRHDHRFSDSAGYGKNERGGDPGKRCGENHLERYLKPRSAERIAALAVGYRYRSHGILA